MVPKAVNEGSGRGRRALELMATYHMGLPTIGTVVSGFVLAIVTDEISFSGRRL